MPDESMSELMAEWDEENGRSEGRPGLENLCKLANALGYKDRQYFGQLSHDACIGDLMEFFEDNSGAIQAVKEWIADQEIPEWKESLESHLPEKEEESEEE
jgi:transcriptional regulator with XRE-family HTH domain